MQAENSMIKICWLDRNNKPSTSYKKDKRITVRQGNDFLNVNDVPNVPDGKNFRLTLDNNKSVSVDTIKFFGVILSSSEVLDI